jgi:hypothetical protein
MGSMRVVASLVLVTIVRLIVIVRGRKILRQGNLEEFTAVDTVNAASVQTMWKGESGLQLSPK